LITMDAAPYFAFVIGLAFGSFFNVLIHRLPREESIVRPGSHCPGCGHAIGPLENIPLISFLLLRGKCKWCGAPISLRYPAVELLAGIAALALWQWFVAPRLSTIITPWQTASAVIESLALLFLIPIAIIDARHYIIPDAFTMPGIAIAVVVSFFPGGLTPLQCVLGMLAGGGSLYAAGFFGKVVLKKDEAMGGGDVRLMAFVGGLWGWKVALAAIFAASLLGSITGLALMLFHVMKKEHKLPFGPFLACGTWTAVVTINSISALYVRWFDRVLSG
jgi:leader peptidase (prepilin peptidase) / N-methyltransferase